MARPKLADETEFIPTTLPQARALQKALVAQGTPVVQARGIVGWLIELPDDQANDELRRRYRAELARLGMPPWRHPGDGTAGGFARPKPPRAPMAPAAAGAAPGLVASVAGGARVVAATHRPIRGSHSYP